MFVSIWVTEACNLRCTYCYEHEKSGRSMDETTAHAVAAMICSQLAETHDTDVVLNFHGGEPMLNLPVMEVIADTVRESARRLGASFGALLTTNGSIASAHAVEFVREYNVSLSISIDGGPDTHDRNRKTVSGDGTHAQALRFFAAVRDIDVPCFARMTVTAESVGDLVDDVMYLSHEGFEVIKPVPDYFDASWDEASVALFERQLERLHGMAGEFAAKNVRITLLDAFRPARPRDRCAVGPHYLNVGVDGSLFPCAFVVGDEQFCFGDVTRGIDSQRLTRVNDLSRTADRTSCAGCGLENVCDSARCTFINYRLSGRLGEPSGAFCALQKALARVAVAHPIERTSEA